MDTDKLFIPMEKEFPSVTTEFVLEEDFIIPDTKPDLNRILLHNCEIICSDTRVQDQKVVVNGQLHFSILYAPEPNGPVLKSLEGTMAFDEQLPMDGVCSSDTIETHLHIEDFTIHIINSRKCNLHALVSFTGVKYELYDLELPNMLEDTVPSADRTSLKENSKDLVTQSKDISFLELTTQKKDLCRLREEIRLPDNFPSIEELLWSRITLGDVEMTPANQKISFSCNLHAFFLYLGEGEEAPIRYLEQTIPYSTVLDCTSSETGLLPNIHYQLSSSMVEPRPDADGEIRVFVVEQSLSVSIRLYRERQISILADVFHCKKDCLLTKQNVTLHRLCQHNCSKQTIQGRFPLVTSQEILQLIYPNCNLQVETPRITEEGLELYGSLEVQSLYLGDQDQCPYNSLSASIPFQHTILIPGMEESALCAVHVSFDKVHITSFSATEAELSAQVTYEILVTIPYQEQIITGLGYQEFTPEQRKRLPGIVLYTVKSGDTLWQLAKRYSLPLKRIREDNHLTDDVLSAGQKLLLMR